MPAERDDILHLRHRSNFADLINERRYRQGVEIGVYRGAYAAHLLASCPDLSMVLVDPWDSSAMSRQYDTEAVFAEVRQMQERFGPERVMIIRQSSPAAAEHDLVRGRNFDFVYIDGDHSRDAVTADIHAWWPLLKVGGVMAGHDYNNRGWKRVKQAVDSVFEVVHTTEERCCSWWVEKGADALTGTGPFTFHN